QAQNLIGRFAALKATGVAANPLPLLDLAGGLACDSALVLQLCQLYGLPMTRGGARKLLARLSGHNALLGGAQVGLQLLLGGLRQLLLLAAPVSGGLSLAPAAPVALAQAALAVATTRRTGRLAAAELLRSTAAAGRPGALLRRLAAQDPDTHRWLGDWQRQDRPRQAHAIRLPELLP
ncbi:MAG TPA: YcjF family protein, partial [Cyanobium sp.]|nr:YcjF family protein [Cyanobium sp.]